MEMQLEVSEKYLQFLSDIEDTGFLNGRYIDEAEYEDEYSHNKIQEAMGALQNRIKEYLHRNRRGEFIVYSDWCVHVMTLDRARQSGISERTIEKFLVR